MIKQMKIGIIGQGFVGNAVYQKFKKYYEVLTFDLDSSKSNSTKEKVMSCEIVFVCLPTPMSKDGTCYVGIVEDVLVELDEFAKTRIAVVKSTIAPGTTRKWNEKMKNLTVTFNPEFLTEANAVQDFENQTRIILGGAREATTELKPLFAKPFPNATIVKTDSTYAEMVKYVTNCFLATKVSFANEMYEICKGLEIDYDKVVEYARYDKRLGDSHWAVPGPDGDFGYGGHCFPKDVRALIEVAGSLNVNPTILFATDIKNNNVRNDRDWEDMEGRAVI